MREERSESAQCRQADVSSGRGRTVLARVGHGDRAELELDLEPVLLVVEGAAICVERATSACCGSDRVEKGFGRTDRLAAGPVLPRNVARLRNEPFVDAEDGRAAVA